MIGSLMCRLLDGSRRAKACEWMDPTISYTVVGPNSYQLTAPYHVRTGWKSCAYELYVGDLLVAKMDNEGELTLYPGLCWDGASGPTFNSRDSMSPSAVHDANYRAGRQHRLGPDMRDDVDMLFYRMLLQNGMYKWRARLWYRGVRLGAGYAYSGKPEDIVKVGK